MTCFSLPCCTGSLQNTTSDPQPPPISSHNTIFATHRPTTVIHRRREHHRAYNPPLSFTADDQIHILPLLFRVLPLSLSLSLRYNVSFHDDDGYQVDIDYEPPCLRIPIHSSCSCLRLSHPFRPEPDSSTFVVVVSDVHGQLRGGGGGGGETF